MIKEALGKLVEGRTLSFEEALEATGEIMEGITTGARDMQEASASQMSYTPTSRDIFRARLKLLQSSPAYPSK